MSKLQFLNLSHNALGAVSASAFDDLISLETLDLAGNQDLLAEETLADLAASKSLQNLVNVRVMRSWNSCPGGSFGAHWRECAACPMQGTSSAFLGNENVESCTCPQHYSLQPGIPFHSASTETVIVTANEKTVVTETIVTETVVVHECVCAAGYGTVAGGWVCEDVDECAAELHSCSGNNTVCVNSNGSFACECAAGWRHGIDEEFACDADVDECALQLHNCHIFAACSNAVGSYVCTCAEGFAGNGVQCNRAPEIESIMVGEFSFDASNPPPEGHVLPLNVSFSDVGDAGRHWVTVDVGCDGQPEAREEVEAGVMELSTSASLAGTPVGVHPLCVAVEDEGGQSAEEEDDGFVVVYDVTDGFVVGSGFYRSPQGAGRDQALQEEGWALFGFSARYRRRNTMPSGRVRLTVRAGRRRFKFKSKSLEWLVVAGEEQAKFQGEGWLGSNRAKVYKVMVSLQDRTNRGIGWLGQGNGGPSDTIRFKVWDEVTGEVVYDNRASDDDWHYDGTEVLPGRVNIRYPRDRHNLALRPLSAYLDPVEGVRSGGEASGPATIVLVLVGLGLAFVAAGSVLRRRRKAATEEARLLRARDAEMRRPQHVPVASESESEGRAAAAGLSGLRLSSELVVANLTRCRGSQPGSGLTGAAPPSVESPAADAGATAHRELREDRVHLQFVEVGSRLTTAEGTEKTLANKDSALVLSELVHVVQK